MLPRLVVVQEGHTPVDGSVLAHPCRAWDAEELAAMDAVVHWFGD
jgi:hypothetical protein